MSASSNTKKYTSVNPFMRILLSNFLRTITNLAGSIPGQRLLDAGCGEGYSINALLQKHPHVFFTGIDNRIEALVLARIHYPEGRYVGADILRLPFKDNSFDLVVCAEVIEHIKQYQEAFKELRRVTAGYCVISVPYEPFFSLLRFLSGKNLLHGGKHPEHLNRFTKKEIIREVAVHFKIEKVMISFPWLVILGNKSHYAGNAAS
jgi:2-polyprenyl-3-methyl-5-hydroxy-6-metoxy-1,4-benzoquinol methylase